MSSPGQRRGTCGHAMASFDSHLACARCRDKGKGKNPCVEKPDVECSICSNFSPEQRLQLSTPSYKIKKDKREAKKLESTPSKDTESLVDPSVVAVLGAVDKQGTVKSPPTVAPPPPPPPRKKQGKRKLPRLRLLNLLLVVQRILKLHSWMKNGPDRFNRLEAILLARTIEPTFSSSVKVTPTHSPLASAVHSTELFIKPVHPVPATSEFTGTGFSAEKHQSTSQTENNRPTNASMLPGTGSSAPKHQPTSKAQSIRPTSTEPSTGSSAVKRSTSKHRPQSNQPSSTDRPLPSDDQDTGSPALHRARRDTSVSSISEAVSDLSDQHPLDLYTEKGELLDDQYVTGLDQNQPLSQEQTYRETMRGICSFMGWSHVPDIDSSTNTSEDNPFAGPKTPVPGKVSVQIPTEDWLCKKLQKLNTTLVECYPSRGSEAGGLSKDVFLRPAKSQSKWYGLFSDHKVDPSAVSSWCTDAAKLNSSYIRIAKHSGLTSTPPALRRISQETLRRWERSAREAMVICNQAASFNRCLFKVQQTMQDQLKTLRLEGKGKTSHKSS